jgi:hypothetical protein
VAERHAGGRKLCRDAERVGSEQGQDDAGMVAR